jgi:hypothetical protein
MRSNDVQATDERALQDTRWACGGTDLDRTGLTAKRWAGGIAEVPGTLKRLQIGYSQMDVSRLLAKVLYTLRSQALDPDLAATG